MEKKQRRKKKLKDNRIENKKSGSREGKRMKKKRMKDNRRENKKGKL